MLSVVTKNILLTVLLLATAATPAVLSGCADKSGYQEPKFLSERSARFELIGEPLTLRDAGDIYVYGPYLLVCGHDTLSGNTFHIFDKTSGEKVTGSIQFGRNYYGYAMTTLMDGWMRYIDGLLETELVFSVNDILDEETPTVSQSPVLLPGSNLRTWDLGDRYLYHNNSYTDSLSGTSRLELYDKAQGRITAACDIHPIENPYLGECVYRSSRGDISPDGSRAVFGTWRGAILETYDIGDTLRLRSLNYYIEPLVKILLRHSRNHHYEHTDRSRLGTIRSSPASPSSTGRAGL